MKTITLQCPHCDSNFDKSLKAYNLANRKGHISYCTHECASKARSLRALVKLTCEECGTEFSKRKCEVDAGRKFCSHSCSAIVSNKKRVGEANPNYIDGASLYRKIGINEHGNKCELCKFDKDYAIEVHHVDRDRSNSKPENLVVLCANCHSGVHRSKDISDLLNEYLKHR